MRNIRQYLLDLINRDGEPVTYTTRQNHHSHLRKLLEVLSIIQPDPFKRLYEGACFIETPKEGAGDQSREKNFLSDEDIQQILKVWEGDRSKKGIRNLAIIVLSLALGARISEVTRLKRSDVNVERGVVTIRNGKGGKDRDVAIVDDGLPVRTAMLALDKTLPPDYTYLFPSTRRGNHWDKDRPMSRQAVSLIINETSDKSGVDFTHHWFRASLATELLEHGGEQIIGDVLVNFGWSSSETLFRNYFLAADAPNRRRRFKTSRGSKKTDA
jgi:integrase